MDDDGNWHPVAYWSRSLSRQERKRSAIMLECMALVESILHWQVYLRHREFQVITDHHALVYLVTKYNGDPHGTLHRMCIAIQGFSFSVTHRKGSEHLDADAVSRLFQTGDDSEYIDDMDEFRTDNLPLTDKEIAQLEKVYTHPGGRRLA